MKKHELLAPAGSLEICKAVIAAGADAVYLGGEKYGARAFAQNFSCEEVLAALDFAHLYGRKIFLTVNTLLKNKEQGGTLFSYIRPFYERGLDAVIVQDYGAFQFLKRYFPDLPLHISTQTSVSNVYGARFFLEQGAARVVPSRELSLSEIRRIYDETGAELECFVHGALCYSYSGQCLMSSLLGGRSGNRGRCAQPCRLAYEVINEDGGILHKKEKYPISPKDLNTLEILPKLCEAGIYSFKIEGRMKSLEYAAGVTSVYRRYLDLYEGAPEKYAVAKEDLQYLFQLGNRNGFTKGYYEMRSGRAMMTLTESKHTSANAREVYRPVELGKIPISGMVKIRAGEPMQLKLYIETDGQTDSKLLQNKNCRSASNMCVQSVDDKRADSGLSVFGAIVAKAQKRPLTTDDVSKHFSKLGDTPFEMKMMDVVLDGDCFVSVGQMNELRRKGFLQLQNEILAPYRRDTPAFPRKTVKEKAMFGAEKGTPRLNVWVSSPEQLGAVLDFSFVDMVTLDFPNVLMPAACEMGIAFERLKKKNSLAEEKKDFLPAFAENAANRESGRSGLAEHFANTLEWYRKRITAAGKQAAFAMPHVFRENSSEIFSRKECRKALARFDLVWVRTYDELGFFKRDAITVAQNGEKGLSLLKAEKKFMNGAVQNGNSGDSLQNMALDDHLYVFSGESAAAFLALGVKRCTASPELNGKELFHLPNLQTEFPVYGYAPMMISAQCIYKNYMGCRKYAFEGEKKKDRDVLRRDCKNGENRTIEGKLFLRDRYFKKFFVSKNCADCYNVIYNSQPLYLLHQADEVKKLGFGSYRISFTREGTDEVRRVLADYKRAFLDGTPIRPPEDFTKGHFRRGVE